MAIRNDIQQELEQVAPELAHTAPVMPYKVPDGYFEELPAVMLMRIKTRAAKSADEEISALSPLLSGLKKDMPYGVPDGYFEKLSPPPVKEAPVRDISFGRRAWQYAAAAVVAGLIGVGAWIATNRSPIPGPGALAQSDSTPAIELTSISDSAIEDFLDGNVSTITFETSGYSGEIRDEDFRLILAEVSDKELENYLN